MATNDGPKQHSSWRKSIMQSTSAPAMAQGQVNPYDMALQQFDRVADLLKLDSGIAVRGIGRTAAGGGLGAKYGSEPSSNGRSA